MGVDDAMNREEGAAAAVPLNAHSRMLSASRASQVIWSEYERKKIEIQEVKRRNYY